MAKRISISRTLNNLPLALSVLVYVALGLYPFLYREANAKKA
jgi:hypothetical protein